MRLKSLSVCFSLLVFVGLLTLTPAAAQVDEKEKAQKELEQRQELERKTLGLLDEVISGAWGLKLPENRSFIQASAANLLWTRDEKRARNLFWEALNGLGLQTETVDDATTKDPKDPKSKGAPAKTENNEKAQRQYFETYAARRNFLTMVARRDPQLALDMLRATRQPPIQQTNPNFRLPDESNLEQEIANEVAERDPKRALQIARESLAKGLTFQVVNLLTRLNQLNQEIGAEFAGDIIDKLETTSLTTDPEAFWMALNLLVSARTPTPKTENDETPSFVWHPLKLSDDQKRELVEMLTDAALSASTNQNQAGSLSEIMPEIEAFAPDRVAKVKAKLAQVTSKLTNEQQDWKTYNSLFRNATPEQMIRSAGTIGDEQRNELYREAVILAVMRNRADALREVINTEVEDETRRKSLIDSLDAEQVAAAVNKGKSEELQKLLPLIRLKEQRAMAMAELAIMLEKKGQHEEALKLLDEAEPLVKVDFNSESKSQALLALMLAYALVDPGKAFAIMEPIIDRANDNISKLLLLDKIVRSGAVKNGEIVMLSPGVPLDFAMFKYGPGVVALAKADFNRTRAAADRFQRNELKLMARLLMVHSILRSLESPDKPQPGTADLR
ncbi:MAG TPA: hypothetical protein VGJ69_14220 [Pyrinomonadaceae bacterium]|jgi:hypothetical protein